MALAVQLLGTGNPYPNLERRGPAALVIDDGSRWLVDCGEGVLGQLLATGYSLADIDRVLLTHHHSDHTVGFPAFALGSWTSGRKRLFLAGPPGTARMWSLYREMFDRDIDYRVGLGWPREAMEPAVTEVTDGWAYSDGGLSVQARNVDHVGPDCVAYRFERDGHSVVISGDTAYCRQIVELATGADVLVNNCSVSKPPESGKPDGVGWGALRAKLSDHVCTPRDAARIAREAGVRTLVLTHMQPGTDPGYVRAEVRGAGFDGETIVGEDLLTIPATPQAQEES